MAARDDDTCDLLCLDLAKAELARASLPAAADLQRAAAEAQALSDPTRMAIALALAHAGAACVCDLGWIVGRDEKLVSHHLRKLKAAGLAESRRDGRMGIYELTPLGTSAVSALTGEPVP